MKRHSGRFAAFKKLGQENSLNDLTIELPRQEGAIVAQSHFGDELAAARRAASAELTLSEWQLHYRNGSYCHLYADEKGSAEEGGGARKATCEGNCDCAEPEETAASATGGR